MTRRNTLLASLLIVTFLGLAPLPSQDPKRVPAGPFMRLKLEPAKKLLEGIALKDFTMIRKNAEEIRKLTLDESWMIRQTAEYQQESQRFQKAMLLLSKAAEDEDLDASTVAYMQVTLNCVRCHDALRDSKKSSN